MSTSTDSFLKKSIITFQFSEKFKSELIIASRLLIEISNMNDKELLGAKKLLESYLTLLIAEINIGYNILRDDNFSKASVNLREAMDKCFLNDYSEATQIVSKAISNVTTSGQRAMQALMKAKLL